VDSSLQEKKQRAAEGKEVQSKNSGGDSGIKERQEERGITLRPLNMEDSLSLSLSLSLSSYWLVNSMWLPHHGYLFSKFHFGYLPLGSLVLILLAV
jgi:hypothetical protein